MAKRKLLSDEDLARIASGYDDLSEFRTKEPSAYVVIHRRGLFGKLCGHMTRSARRLSDNELAEIASGYDYKRDFLHGDMAAYNTAKSRGIFEKICAHMKEDRLPNGYWIKERCRKEALKYDSRDKFRKGSPGAYRSALEQGWLDEVCCHMKPQGNWTKRKIYVFTFSDGYAYVGLTNNVKQRLSQHLSRKKRSPVYRHIQETGASFEFKILTDEWIDMDAAGRVEDQYISQYADDGWKMLNKRGGGGLGGPKRTYYTPNRLRREVSKYEYLHDFRKKSPRYYKTAPENHAVFSRVDEWRRVIVLFRPFSLGSLCNAVSFPG